MVVRNVNKAGVGCYDVVVWQLNA